MYKIKANGNYNIILKDIGVYFSHPQEVVVSEEKYNQSKHIKMFLQSGIITVEKIEVNNTSSSSNSNEKQELIKQDTVFVSEGSTSISNDGVFVRSGDEEKVVNVQEVQHVNVVDSEITQNNIEEVLVQQETIADDANNSEDTLNLNKDYYEEVSDEHQLNLIDEINGASDEELVDVIVAEEENLEVLSSEVSESKTKSFGKKKFNKKK